MKNCPFCAESIQDAAILCKHCGRELAATSTKASGSTPDRRPRSRVPFLVMIAVMVSVVGLWMSGMEKNREAAAAAAMASAQEAAERLRRTPVVVNISNESALEIGSESMIRWEVTVPVEKPNCRLTGRVLGLAGGNKDVVAMVLTADDYINMRNNHVVKPVFSSGQQTAIPLDVPLSMPGNYVFAISNMFSVFTPKTVQTQDVRVTCSAA